MKRSKLTATLVISMILLQGCSFFGQKSNTQTSKTSSDSEDQYLQTITSKTISAEKSLDLNKCKDIEDKNLQDQCVTNINYTLASEKVDAKYCAVIPDEKMKKDCNMKIDILKNRK